MLAAVSSASNAVKIIITAVTAKTMALSKSVTHKIALEISNDIFFVRASKCFREAGGRVYKII